MHDQPFLLRCSLSLLVALVACKAEDEPGESGPGSSTGEEMTSTTSGPDPDGTTTTPTPETSSTTDDLTTGVDTTAAEEESSSGPPPSDGECIGLDQLGNLGAVASRDGMLIDTTCDSTPAPCGGDIVGTWWAETTCGYESYPNPLEMDCPGSTFELTVVSQTGTYTFGDDGSYTQDLTTELMITITLDPMACYGIDCATFEAVVQMDNPGATCQAMGPTCTCTIANPPENSVVVGTYEVFGDQAVITVDGSGQAIPYCIEGDRLAMWNGIYDMPVSTGVLCGNQQDCIDALGDTYDLVLCTSDLPGGG